jgi:hypothetical protein
MRLPATDHLRDCLISGIAKGQQDLDWSALMLGAEEDARLSSQAWERKKVHDGQDAVTA